MMLTSEQDLIEKHLPWRLRATIEGAKNYIASGSWCTNPEGLLYPEAISTNILFGAAIGQRLLFNFLGVAINAETGQLIEYKTKKPEEQYITKISMPLPAISAETTESEKTIIAAGYKTTNDLAHFNISPTQHNDTVNEIICGSVLAAHLIKKYVYDPMHRDLVEIGFCNLTIELMKKGVAHPKIQGMCPKQEASKSS